MLEGELVTVRLMRETEIELYFELIQKSVTNRGQYFPSGPTSFESLPALKKRFQEDGFWDPAHRLSILMIVDKSDQLVGRIGWNPGLFDGYEIGWIIFDPADRGKGYTTEAVKLVVPWMFKGMKMNRIEAFCHPDNIASQRVAEKCGLQHEATLRGIWYQHGKYQDLELYRILPEEYEKAVI